MKKWPFFLAKAHFDVSATDVLEDQLWGPLDGNKSRRHSVYKTKL